MFDKNNDHCILVCQQQKWGKIPKYLWKQPFSLYFAVSDWALTPKLFLLVPLILFRIERDKKETKQLIAVTTSTNRI